MKKPTGRCIEIVFVDIQGDNWSIVRTSDLNKMVLVIVGTGRAMVQRLYTLEDNPVEYAKYRCTGQSSTLIVDDTKVVCTSRLEVIDALEAFYIPGGKIIKDMLAMRLNLFSFEESCAQTKIQVGAFGHRARQQRGSMSHRF